MRTSIVPVLLIVVNLAAACKKNDSSIITGQLYGTPTHQSHETLNGKPSEMKVSTYWAKSENGAVVKDRPVTAEDRKTTPFTNDYSEEYNTSGILTRFSLFGDNGVLKYFWKSEVSNGLISKAFYTVSDTVKGYYQNFYNGDLLTEVRYSDSLTDSLRGYIRYEYAADRSETIIRLFNAVNTLLSYRILGYDKKGNLVYVKFFNREDKLTQQYDYTYDANGRRIGHHQQDFINQRVIDYNFTYEFDSHNNYVTVIFYKDAKPFVIRERKITYYE